MMATWGRGGGTRRLEAKCEMKTIKQAKESTVPSVLCPCPFLNRTLFPSPQYLVLPVFFFFFQGFNPLFSFILFVHRFHLPTTSSNDVVRLGRRRPVC